MHLGIRNHLTRDSLFVLMYFHNEGVGVGVEEGAKMQFLGPGAVNFGMIPNDPTSHDPKDRFSLRKEKLLKSK